MRLLEINISVLTSANSSPFPHSTFSSSFLWQINKFLFKNLQNFLVIGCEDSVVWEPLPIFGFAETMCIFWFTFEYILRITVAPNRLQFFCGIMNIVDLVAIIPFFLEIGLSICGIDIESINDIKGPYF